MCVDYSNLDIVERRILYEEAEVEVGLILSTQVTLKPSPFFPLSFRDDDDVMVPLSVLYLLPFLKVINVINLLLLSNVPSTLQSFP
jgi:hypothetical protein